MQVSPVISLCPSFENCSSGTMAETAARVVQEEEEFEFAFVTTGSNWSPISADEIFSNGQIKPVFGATRSNGGVKSKPPEMAPSRRSPLRKLLIEEREATTSSSCSSSEADDLESVPAGTYCVWEPKKLSESGRKCKKSKSAGSSKRWKLRDLLHRSNSEGKDSFIFLSPSGKAVENGVAGESVSAAAAHYVKSRTVKEGGEKRRSYLPYKKELVGILANVNGLSRNLRPF